MFSAILTKTFDKLASYIEDVPNGVRRKIVKNVKGVYKDCKKEDIVILRYVHKDDTYLYRVVVCLDSLEGAEKYVMWTYNSSFDGLYGGEYDCTDTDVINLLSTEY